MALKLSLKLFFDALLNFTRFIADDVIGHSSLSLIQAVLALHNNYTRHIRKMILAKLTRTLHK